MFRILALQAATPTFVFAQDWQPMRGAEIVADGSITDRAFAA
jgi:hypothetical protein